jgi:nucleoside-diphosphate-sugar epimerase
MKILVTGANGFVGKNLCLALENIISGKDRTRPNLICSYGWNEHEEGGWLCPTLSVDENNNVIYDESGKIVADTTRIDILASAFEEFK